MQIDKKKKNKINEVEEEEEKKWEYNLHRKVMLACDFPTFNSWTDSKKKKKKKVTHSRETQLWSIMTHDQKPKEERSHLESQEFCNVVAKKIKNI